MRIEFDEDKRIDIYPENEEDILNIGKLQAILGRGTTRWVKSKDGASRLEKYTLQKGYLVDDILNIPRFIK